MTKIAAVYTLLINGYGLMSEKEIFVVWNGLSFELLRRDAVHDADLEQLEEAVKPGLLGYGREIYRFKAVFISRVVKKFF